MLVAEHQTAGRGRLGRDWVSPPARSSLTVSFLLSRTAAPERWPWLPLITGSRRQTPYDGSPASMPR